ncbi:MAG: acyl-CoA dehydrogenase [Heliobacteriaceae bacterium]|nr:acyl-CoA dehydrogenase [Heliobacteriaceae bacterium]
MNFKLTEEQELIRKVAREFAEKEVAPLAKEVDQNHRFPEETVTRMKELNLMGIPFPEKYGGSGGDTLSYILVVEELSKACATTGVILSAHTSLSAFPIYQWGTEEQKQKYLIPMANGEKLGAFALTEPGAGTDAASQKTVAVLQGDSYILNGSKCFITNGDYAEIYIVFALTEPEKGTKGISAFIVEKGTPGFEIGQKEDKLGIKGSSTVELYFKNCKIPKENLLGKEGRGFGIAMGSLDGGRVGVAAQALGIAEACLNLSVSYAKERHQFKKPIGTFQAIQWMIAEMGTRIEASRYLVYNAAWRKDQNLPFSQEAAMAKLFAAETAMFAGIKAVQILGGHGYTTNFPAERYMRDAKITEIYEGTSEVQKMVIAGSLLR